MIDREGFLAKLIFDESVASIKKYPYNLPFVKDLNSLIFNKNVTFFVGENGCGKSTLVEAIAISYGFNAEGGSINFTFSTCQTSSDLYKHIKLAKKFNHPQDGYFLRAESFYNVASTIKLLDEIPARSSKLIESYGGTSLHKQSHGESFFSLFMHRFGGNGLYILDEPEAALSVERQFAFLSRLHELVKSGSQFIIATHSPIILSYPQATIYKLDDYGIKSLAYEETQQYKLTKSFINNYSRYLDELLI